jgi:hypothetical protein
MHRRRTRRKQHRIVRVLRSNPAASPPLYALPQFVVCARIAASSASVVDGILAKGAALAAPTSTNTPKAKHE